MIDHITEVNKNVDEIEHIEKYNPYHGKDGRFASKNGGGAGATSAGAGTTAGGATAGGADGAATGRFSAKDCAGNQKLASRVNELDKELKNNGYEKGVTKIVNGAPGYATAYFSPRDAIAIETTNKGDNIFRWHGTGHKSAKYAIDYALGRRVPDFVDQ